MEETRGNNIANNVARAIVAALDWNSTRCLFPRIRIKTGDVRVLANASFLLVKKDWSSEIRLQAYKMLQYLVWLRREELSLMERRNFANVGVELMSEIIVRREGIELWQELLPSLVSLCGQGPVQAELVAMMLRWLLEDITVHNEDLECNFVVCVCVLITEICVKEIEYFELWKLGDWRWLLLWGLTQSLPEILPLLYIILMNVSREFLYKSGSSAGVVDESEFEFAEYVCESMVSLGSSNLECISGDSIILSLYLQQMLGFFQHYELTLHYQSLLFWLVLMRDLMSKPKVVVLSSGGGSAVNNVGFGSGQVDNEKTKILGLMSDDICNAILDNTFQRMLKREKSRDILFSWGIGVLMKFVASFKPLIASAKVSETIFSIIKSFSISAIPVQELAVMESTQVALENIVSAIFDGSHEFAGGSSEVHLAFCRIFEGLLQQLLSLKWMEPALVEVLGHYLDALGPFLKYFPDAVGSVIDKLFELLTSLPFAVKDVADTMAYMQEKVV
ncbi:hypothetical protein P3X46_008441 [Hevea brasiliensis]|uniref:Exportin-5 C-terminal domain-containing protein n=1 Tax=Hevea brasiliensis TaxID=3981 RepID=A0ABQ9MLB0_HEVBR|nr:hypothetical protein P3X46_008441 [Hevea brasiliensis]